METVQYFPSRLGKQIIQALDNKVVVLDRDIFSEHQYEYEYKELGRKTTRGKTGESGWTNIATFLFLFTFFVSIMIQVLAHVTSEAVLISGLALAGIAFLLRFIKSDFVSFYTKKNEYAFHIQISGKNRQKAEEMIAHLSERIIAEESKIDKNGPQ